MFPASYAFEVTSDDVLSVLMFYRSRLNPSQPITESYAESLLMDIDLDRVARVAVKHSNDMDEQTAAARDEIRVILVEMGVLDGKAKMVSLKDLDQHSRQNMRRQRAEYLMSQRGMDRTIRLLDVLPESEALESAARRHGTTIQFDELPGYLAVVRGDPVTCPFESNMDAYLALSAVVDINKAPGSASGIEIRVSHGKLAELEDAAAGLGIKLYDRTVSSVYGHYRLIDVVTQREELAHQVVNKSKGPRP